MTDFAGRVIFPVFDVQGKPIAFGGRTLDPDGDPKYLNSPETPAYIKGRNLYGLHLTRDEIRRQGFAILVEGYLDLIVPYQYGVRNIVASLGTALTPEQVKLIGRFAHKVLVNYDGDRAGVAARSGRSKRFWQKISKSRFWFSRTTLILTISFEKTALSNITDVGLKHGPTIQFVIDQLYGIAISTRRPIRPRRSKRPLPLFAPVGTRFRSANTLTFAMDGLRVQRDQRRELWRQVRGASS
jgi:hypothetical protein